MNNLIFENNIKKNRYKITFAFELLENVDQVLVNVLILQKSFSKEVTYLIEVDEQYSDKIIYLLLLATSKQIKIENVSYLSNHDDFEVGTDKPLGSKAAIDEN